MRAAIALLLAAVACSPGTGETAPTVTPSPTVSSAVADIAYVTAHSVVLRGRTGAVRTLGTVPAGEDVGGLAWSAGARYVGWLQRGAEFSTVYVYDVVADRTVSWEASAASVGAGSVGTSAGGFVVVTGDRRMVLLDPATLFAGGSVPYVSITGSQGTPRLLATNARRILLATDEEASGEGGPETVYDVTPDGRATRLFTDGDGEPEGEVRNLPMGQAALTGDGTRLVYEAGATPGRAFPCEYAVFTAIRDLGANREVPASSPTIPGARVVAPASIATGADGTTYEALRTVDGCRQPARSALFRLSGNHWATVTDDAKWGAASADGRLAVIRTSGALVVGGHAVARDVTLAAWAPSHG